MRPISAASAVTVNAVATQRSNPTTQKVDAAISAAYR